MFNYEQYCQMCKEKSIENPYKTESDFNRAYGICDYKEPLVITPNNKKRPMKPTFDNSEKSVVKKRLTAQKKPKAVKKIITPEEARLRRNERRRMNAAAKREERGTPKKRRMSDEEKRIYKQEYMKKWRELHPHASYEATMKWRRENPEENKRRRREEAARRRERKRAQLSVKSASTDDLPVSREDQIATQEAQQLSIFNEEV